MLNREHDIRVWNFMVEAWAGAIIWGIFKAMSLDDIAKLVSIDGDKKFYKDPTDCLVKKSGK